MFITQALGGSFTAMTDQGYMVRIEGKDADAIGEEVQAGPTAEELASKPLADLAWDQLRTCYDPEIPVNIVDLGLVYSCEVTPLETGGQQGLGALLADRARLRHGRRAQARHRAEGRGAAGRERSRRATCVRPSLGPEPHVRSRPPAAGADVRADEAQHAGGIRPALPAAAGQGGEGSLTIAELGGWRASPPPTWPRSCACCARRASCAASAARPGGYALARPADQTCVGEVLARLGSPLYDASFCQRHSGVSVPARTWADCSIRPVLRHVQDAIDEVLGRLTLTSLLAASARWPPGPAPRAVPVVLRPAEPGPPTTG